MTSYLARVLVTLIAIVSASAWAAPLALADTSSSTGVSVTIADAGDLAIAWTGDSPAFLTDGQAPVLNAASPTATAIATFSLAITDTRPDATRSGYIVALRAAPFTAEGSKSTIGPGQLTIVSVAGSPEGTSAATAIGAPLSDSVAVLAVPDGVVAVATTLTITVAMTIAPGTMPGAYAGGLTFDILPLLGP